MTNILILGANGQLARNTARYLLKHTDVRLRLYLRRASRLKNPAAQRMEIVEGDVLDQAALRAAMQGQDVAFASLAGALAEQARAFIDAMHASGCRCVIFTSSMGIYGEVPGERYRSVLDPYRDAAALIEASDLDFTILRPGWFTSDKSVDYRLTHKGEPFRGHDVSLDSVPDVVASIAITPTLYSRSSLGIARV